MTILIIERADKDDVVIPNAHCTEVRIASTGVLHVIKNSSLSSDVIATFPAGEWLAAYPQEDG